MADKAGGFPRGLFDTKDRAVEDVVASPEAEADVLSTGRGAVALLSIVGRLQALEAAAREARIAQLGAEEKVRTVVLDNEEAEAKIEEQVLEIVDLQQQLSTALARVEELEAQTTAGGVEIQQAIGLIRAVLINIQDQGLQNIVDNGFLQSALTLLGATIFTPPPPPPPPPPPQEVEPPGE